MMACVDVGWAEGTQPLSLVFWANCRGKGLSGKLSDQILSQGCRLTPSLSQQTGCVMQGHHLRLTSGGCVV